LIPSERLVAAGGALTFAFIGAVQALYGPLLPAFRSSFAIDAGAAGLVFAVHGAGSLCGILAPGVLRSRPLARHGLAVATTLLFIGAAGLALAPTWPWLLAAAFVFALGFGVHVVRLNELFVTGFGAGGMAMSQLINCAFSVGTILGPLALAAVAHPSPRLFGLVATLALALLPASVLIERTAPRMAVASTERSPVLAEAKDSWRRLAAFMAIMCLVGGVENSIGGWTATLALAAGYAYRDAANLTALFFGAILAGRLAAVGLAQRVPAGRLVTGSLAGIAVFVAGAVFTSAGVIALALTGLAVAPIFAATLVWLGAALPHSRHAGAVVIAASLLGSGMFPALVGRVIERFGEAAAPPAILMLAVAALVVALRLRPVPGG